MLPLIDLHSQLDEELNISTDDSQFSHQFYTDLINEQRALMIRNEYNRNRNMDPNIQQTIGCMELELVDPHNCCVDIPIGCKILRTKQQLPNTVEFHHNKAITSVGPVDITERRFSLIDYSRVPYVGNGRVTGSIIYTFLYDRYLYVFSKDNPLLKILKKVAVRGIFEDPTELAQLNNCSTGKPCWSPKDKYPINLHMWVYIKNAILQNLGRKKQIPLDDSNNSHDDVTGPEGRQQPSK